MGDFDRANQLADEYGRMMASALRAAPLAARLAIYEQALATLNENLHLARVLRAHLATRLRANSGLFLYQRSESERHIWQMQA